MSNTYKHKGKGYWNNGIEDRSKPEIRKYLEYCNRHNREFSYFKKYQLKIADKIMAEQEEIDLVEYGL